MKPRAVHLADQALAILAGAETPMTTRDLARHIQPPGQSLIRPDTRRALEWLEQTGQIRTVREPGRHPRWEATAVPLPVHLMPPLNVTDPEEHRP